MEKLIEVALLLAILLIFTVVSHKKKVLEREGILVANIVGIAIYLTGNFIHFLMIVLFFVVAEVSTRMARKNREVGHERRTTGNILGNSGAAMIALFAGSEIAFFGAIAAALADTLSSEIGLLSKRKPILITTFKKVKSGTDGGITPLGLVAAIFGGGIVGLVHFLIYGNPISFLFLIGAGFIGSLIDSVFGAIYERERLLSNAEVNFLGGSGGAITAHLLHTLI